MPNVFPDLKYRQRVRIFVRINPDPLNWYKVDVFRCHGARTNGGRQVMANQKDSIIIIRKPDLWVSA